LRAAASDPWRGLVWSGCCVLSCLARGAALSGLGVACCRVWSAVRLRPVPVLRATAT